MPTFSYLYAIPYLILFLCMYLNIIPIRNKDEIIGDNNDSFLQIFILSISLLIFIGFRGYVYSDWVGYYIEYNKSPSFFDGKLKINSFISENDWEVGFLFYLIFCKTISGNYFFLQISSFIIDFLIIFYFFKRYIHKQIVFCFLLFILFSGLNIEINLLRNSKAIMLFLISIKYIEKKQFLKYVFINIIGSLFHISALLYLPVYFIFNVKISKKVILLLFIIGNFMYVFQIQWFRSILLSFSVWLPGRLKVITEAYLSSKFYSSSYGITIGYIERTLTFLVVYCSSNNLYKINNNNIIFLNAMYLYLFIFLYFSEISILLGRIPILFIFSYWIIYPRIYSFLSRKYKMVFLGLLLVYGVLKIFEMNDNVLTSYDNILFFHKSYHERLLLLKHHSRIIFQ